MGNFKLQATNNFAKSAFKLSKNNLAISLQIQDSLISLSNDPFNISLRTHKVRTRLYGYAFSSRVNGDLRIIWLFERNRDIILLDIGGHDYVYG